METKRNRLNELFIMNPAIFAAKKIYIWISDRKRDIENMSYIFKYCVAYKVHFSGFVTNCKHLIGLSVLNKSVYSISEIMGHSSLILSEDTSSEFYCPIKVLNPKLNVSNIVIWGAGNRGKEVAGYFIKKNLVVKYFIDSDQNKIGSNIDGVEICSIEKAETLSSDVSLIEASDRYLEIDKVVQDKAPQVDCYVYSATEGVRYFSLGELMYLREIVQNKNIYIYGYNQKAVQWSQCLTILDYNFTGFLVDENQYENVSKKGVALMLPEEILYCDNYYVIIITDDRKSAVKRLRDLGLKYAVDFSPIETLPHYLLYARKNIIDINLGHTYKQNTGINGIEIYGRKYLDSYKIAVLGGSTTDGRLFPFKSWPEILYDKINRDRFIVYNAGVSGYTSAQELIQMIRDIVLLEPNMIIVYDGYNDTSEINACPGKYFEFNYLKKALNFAREHMSHNWDFISQDEDLEEKESMIPIIGNFENWLMNIEMMHAIAVDREIQFYSFLQPMLSNKKNLTNKEKGILFEVENFQNLKRTSSMGKEFRNKISNAILTHDYIYDMSNIFDDYSDVYMDICHVREGANEVIATEILNRIEIPL